MTTNKQLIRVLNEVRNGKGKAMATTRAKRPQSEVIVSNAENLYKQIARAEFDAPLGSDISEKYKTLKAAAADLALACKEALQPREPDDSE